ncbi:MAG: hypothetical protein GY711_13530 [bacterium]|nr:hypothetical protein [bacterium]
MPPSDADTPQLGSVLAPTDARAPAGLSLAVVHLDPAGSAVLVPVDGFAETTVDDVALAEGAHAQHTLVARPRLAVLETTAELRDWGRVGDLEAASIAAIQRGIQAILERPEPWGEPPSEELQAWLDAVHAYVQLRWPGRLERVRSCAW